MTKEILTFVIALVGMAIVIFLLRRLSAKSKQTAGTARDRLGMTTPDEPQKPVRQRRTPRPNRDRSGGVIDPDAKPATTSGDGKRLDPPVDVGAEAEVDADAKAAYRAGLSKTRGGFVARLAKAFSKKQIDASLLDELEEVLFTADIGPRAADRIFQSVKQSLSRDELTDEGKIWRKIRQTSREILAVDAPALDLGRAKPFVLLVLGVNGVGKTTTIGKLAALWAGQGKKVILGAGDTFRAAAAEQLEEWGKRAGVPVVRGKAGGDPSSVIFDAVKRGVDDGADIVICDTAGRLQTNAGLMDELKKVRRVIDKAMPGAPHETWMVLDSTTGQNAISQAKTFKAEMEITGIVMTKLDGSAKGGVVLGICDELKVPVRYIGVGEKLADLRPFDAPAFVEALFDTGGSDESAASGNLSET